MSSKNNDEEKDEAVLLATALTDTEVLLFEGILRENFIPFLRKDRGSGEAMGIIMGFSLYGSDFYVERSRYDEAADLLEAYTNPISDESDIESEDDLEVDGEINEDDIDPE